MNGDNAKVFLQAPDPEGGRRLLYPIITAVVGICIVAGVFISKQFIERKPQPENYSPLLAADSQETEVDPGSESPLEVEETPSEETKYSSVSVKPPKLPPEMDLDDQPPAHAAAALETAPEKTRELPKKKVVTPAPAKVAATGAVVKGSAANFRQEVDRSKGVVLVDFWAPWCGPCRQVSPIVDELAREFKSSVKVVKVNVDEAPALSSRFGINAIPCLMIFKDGKLVDRQVGGQGKDVLKTWLKKYAN